MRSMPELFFLLPALPEGIYLQFIQFIHMDHKAETAGGERG